MIKFNKPNQLNGTQLIAELKAIGVIVNEKTSPLLDGNGDFWLDIPAKDETKAKPIVDAHNGTTVAPEPTITQKLASVGLTIDDLKAVLLS
jgi:hypothetical protein